MQGNSATVIDFVNKLELWQEKVKMCRYNVFENMSNSFVALHEDEVNGISIFIQEHLTCLGKEFNRNPFKNDPKSLPIEFQDE